MRRSRALLVVSTLFLASHLLACQATRERIQATTTPPDLRYVPPEQIRTAMWVLAAEIQELERILETPGLLDRPSTQSDVRARLARMRVAAESLDVPGKTTQHPVLNQNLERFLARLRQAERGVDRDPPNYFPASTIAGSCFVCHGQTVGLSPDSAGKEYASMPQAVKPATHSKFFSFDSSQREVQERVPTTR